MMYLYLSGTITPDPQYLEWRKWVERFFAVNCNVMIYSPIRGKNPDDWDVRGLEATRQNLTYASGGFVARDKLDVRDLSRHRGVMLLHFHEAPARQSIGTWTEFGWATMLDVPVVVSSALPEVVEHPFVYRQAAKICPTLGEACEYVKFLLS